MTFKTELNRYKEKVDNQLNKFLDSKIKSAKNPFLMQSYTWIKDYIMSGGKRLRPSLVVATYKTLTGQDNNDIYNAALSVELFHNYTLIHDDLMDEDFERRGKPGINYHLKNYYYKISNEEVYLGQIFDRVSSRFLVTMAILYGSILNTWGTELLATSEFPLEQINKALMIYNQANTIVNEGQILDNYFETQKDVTEPQYLSMIEAKTGNLFKASIQIGAILANATPQQYAALSRYGMLTPPAFQLLDDIMDIDNKGKKGHAFGSDIKAGKNTLLVIKAREKATKEQLLILNSILDKKNATETEVLSVVDVIKGSGALAYVQDLALTMIEQGKGALAKSGIHKNNIIFFYGFSDYLLEGLKASQRNT